VEEFQTENLVSEWGCKPAGSILVNQEVCAVQLYRRIDLFIRNIKNHIFLTLKVRKFKKTCRFWKS